MAMIAQACFVPRADANDLERALGYLEGGWCPWPHLVAPAADATKLDGKALCPCGKRVRVTARGLYSHHKPNSRPRPDEVRAYQSKVTP